jgi:hypothetical protein
MGRELRGRAPRGAGPSPPPAPREAGANRLQGEVVARGSRAARGPATRDARRRRRRPPRAGGCRAGPRPTLPAGDHRRTNLPARLHQERAGGEAERSGEAQGMGSRRLGDRALPPGLRHQGPEPGPRSGGEASSRASAAGGDAAAAPSSTCLGRSQREQRCALDTLRLQSSDRPARQAPSIQDPLAPLGSSRLPAQTGGIGSGAELPEDPTRKPFLGGSLQRVSAANSGGIRKSHRILRSARRWA